jgi:streptogrisin C
MIRSLSSLGLLAALLAAPAATARNGPAEPAVPPQIRESVAYLTSTYHISAAEAVRRLRLQADTDTLTRRLAVALPREYAGAWLDQEQGGVLDVASTRPGHTRQVISRLPHAAEIRVLPAAYSLTDLTRLQRRAGARTGASARGAYAQVDVMRNRVAVWTGRGADVSRAVAALGQDRQAVTVRTWPRQTPTACTFLECDPPIRGGITIGIGKLSGDIIDYCTSGFNIHDNQGRLYTSTAGHCFTQVKKPQKAQTIVSLKEHDGKKIVANRSLAGSVVRVSSGPRLDFAFVRVEDTATWFPAGKPRNIDFFKCSEEAQPELCNTDLQKHRYRITGIKPYNNMMVGEVVCMSGASIQEFKVKPGTRCGKITALPGGGIQTNICAKRGDSGSPLFDQNTHEAYGIENSIAGSDEGKCPPPNEQQTFYTALSSALAAADSPGVTYSLIAH